MRATRGRIVRTPSKKQPYKVVLEYDQSGDTEHPVETVREGEALIKEQSPKPVKRDRSRDMPADPVLVEDSRD